MNYKTFSLHILTILVILITSCSEKNKNIESKNEIEKININVSDNEENVQLSKLFSNFKVIPLETSKECYLPVIEEVFLTNKKIFLRANSVIYIYSTSGKYLNKIDDIGKGPKEHEYISDMGIDTVNKTLEFIDFYNLKLVTYDFEGNFIQSRKLPFFTDAFSKIDDSYFLFTTDPNDVTNYKLNLYDFNANKIISKYFKINTHYNEFLNFWHNTVFYKYNNSIHLVLNPFDTIYTINKDGYKYKYVLNFGKNKIPKSFYDKNYSDIIDFSKKATKQNYAYNADKFYESEQFLFFQFKYQNKYKRAVYDKRNKKVTIIKGFVDDIFSSSVRIKDFIWPVGQKENKLVFMFEPSFLKELYLNEEVKNKKLKNIINNITENDNPVLFVGTLTK